MAAFGRIGTREIEETTLVSSRAEASIIELGATVRDLKIRRRDNTWVRVVLGLNSVEDYLAHSPNFGNIVGRFAGRIGRAQFTLDGVAHRLPVTPGRTFCLHGGNQTGFGKTPWRLQHHDASSATYVLVSPDGDNGFPGCMVVSCRYTLIEATLRLDLSATTDQPTVINLSHHGYFNLTGRAATGDHKLEVRANVYAPADSENVPTGALAAVAGTPLDFRTPRDVASANGLDHSFLLCREKTDVRDGYSLAHAASLTAPDDSLTMQVWTSEPALQVYDGANVNVPVAGLDGARYGRHAGIALEPGHVPDSPNLPHFPSTVLRPGQVYRQRTDYRFD